VSYLESLINSLTPVVPDLANVLNVGNSAGTTDIDLNNQDILQVNNIDLTTINGSAYPPAPPATPAWSATLQVSNNAGTNNVDLNNNDINNVDNIQLNTINGSAYPLPTPTFNEVLIAGNTSSNIFQLVNGTTNLNTQSGQQINLEGNGTISGGSISSTDITRSQMVIQDTNGTGILARNTITNGGMVFNLDDSNLTGSAGGQFVANIGGSNVANISLGAVGIATPPFPAPSGSIGINTTPSTALIQLSQSAPFANASVLSIDLFGITHNQSTGSPSPNNDFKISTNKQLTLRADGAGGGGYGILIDNNTPNITYQFAGTNPNNRLEIDNTGSINSVNVGSSQAGSFNFSTLLFQDFVQSKTVDLTTNGMFFSAPASQSSSFTTSQLTFNSGIVGSTNNSLNSATFTMNDTATNGGQMLLNANSLSITDRASGGGANPILQLTNTNNSNSSVYLEAYKNKGVAGTAGDTLFQQSVFGQDGGNAKQEFTRITHTIRDPSAGAEDGSMELGVLVNGGFANFIQLNGNDTPIGEVNFTRPLDFIGGSDANATIKIGNPGSVNLNLDTTGSAGTGAIALKTKNGTAGSGGGLLLTGNTLESASAGGSSGQHLCITLNGVPYKIKLENP
jgi:hypothetical protein